MHANCSELLKHIEMINPKNVYTMYGFDSEFASIVRHKLRIPSRPLKLAKKNLTLEEYM